MKVAHGIYLFRGESPKIDKEKRQEVVLTSWRHAAIFGSMNDNAVLISSIVRVLG